MHWSPALEKMFGECDERPVAWRGVTGGERLEMPGEFVGKDADKSNVGGKRLPCLVDPVERVEWIDVCDVMTECGRIVLKVPLARIA